MHADLEVQIRNGENIAWEVRKTDSPFANNRLVVELTNPGGKLVELRLYMSSEHLAALEVAIQEARQANAIPH